MKTRRPFPLLLALLVSTGAWAQPGADALAEAQARTYAPIALDGFRDAIHHAIMRLEEVAYERYRPDQIVHVAENLLLYQNADGGWPKDQDWLCALTDEERAALQRGGWPERGRRTSTLDNRTTYTQVAYLAEVYNQTGLERYRAAAMRGLDYVLDEQRPSGGWRGSDVEAITFNDDVMAGALATLDAVAAGEPPFGFVDAELRARAAEAVERGIAVVLRCQVTIGGVPTAWGQQHDHETCAPVAARTFEPASLASAESVGIVRFLMSLEAPPPAVVEAVEHAVAWMERAKIEGIRVDTVAAAPTTFRHHRSTIDRLAVEDPSAPPIWARMYALDDGVTPIFANRDRRIVYSLAEVERERRTGYAWYGYWPAALLAHKYPAWQRVNARGERVPRAGQPDGLRAAAGAVVLLDEDFSGFRPGLVSSMVGAHTEYHYLPEAAPVGGWAISTFRWTPGSQRAWRALEDARGDRVMAQTHTNPERHTHPMLVAGDSLWTDYTATVRFAPETPDRRSGLVVRYRNDRCYYFVGVEGGRAVLLKVQHAMGFRKPYEEVLAEVPFDWTPGDYLTAAVAVDGPAIRAAFEGGPTLEATDSTYAKGKVGLTADGPTRYSHVRVTAAAPAAVRFREEQVAREREAAALQAQNPTMTLWKRISTTGFGVGRNLRFGDLDGDGQTDILVAQVLHHGPKDRHSEVGALTALTLDGEVLWQRGTPDVWKDHLTNDVAVQVHDLDGDGRSEVVYAKDFELVVADGATGETKYKAPTPPSKDPSYRFDQILGDALFFADVRGTGQARDVLIKDRYRHFWVLDDRLNVLWTGENRTGHYPYAYDVDADGRDEIAIGYALYDDDGTLLWNLDDTIQDHADGVAVVPFKPDEPPFLLNAASDAGMLFIDLDGTIRKHHWIGHVQNPSVADYRPDLPGLETATINFWGNQGIIHLFDADGDRYHDFEPVQHGSMMLPVNWTGTGQEYFLLSADVTEGGLYDGWGRRVVRFPADGHPDLATAVLDLTGDARDEIVVWDPYEIWIYTQDDNPKPGRLYAPVRNPLHNYSNYQATISLPGWSDE